MFADSAASARVTAFIDSAWYDRRGRRPVIEWAICFNPSLIGVCLKAHLCAFAISLAGRCGGRLH